MLNNTDLKTKLNSVSAYASLIAARQDAVLANTVNAKQSGIVLPLTLISMDDFVGVMSPLVYYLMQDKYNFFGTSPSTATKSGMWVEIYSDLINSKLTVSLTDTRFTTIIADLYADMLSRTNDARAQAFATAIAAGLFKTTGSQAEAWYGLGTTLTFTDIANALNS